MSVGQSAPRAADFSPEDLYTRKRSIESKDNSGVPGVVLLLEKCQKLSSTRSKEIHDDESILDSEVENIVGLADSSQLEMEKGRCLEEAATTLHSCFYAYHLADKRNLLFI